MKTKPLKKCPVCGATSPEWESEYHKQRYPNYKMKNYRAHIRKIAEREIFMKALLGIKDKTPHFDYYKKNMVILTSKSVSVRI